MQNSTKAIGKITKCMEKVLSSGQMEEFMQENTFRIKNMDLVEFNGLMEKSMKDTGDKVFKMEKEK